MWFLGDVYVVGEYVSVFVFDVGELFDVGGGLFDVFFVGVC